jgi:RHS repeat-associated protein
LNRLVQMTQGGAGVAAKRVDLVYDAASQMTSLTRYSDLAGTQLVATSNYGFDRDGRLTSLAHQRGSQVLANYGFVYDAGDRITQMTSADGVSNYDYDLTNQLTGADYDYQTDEAYSYDANGNRTNAGYGTGAGNRLLTDGVYAYVYDAEGNRTKRTELATGEVTEYVWDLRNRLTAVRIKDGAGVLLSEASYVYDVNNQRIGKTVDGDGVGAGVATTERYVYDGNQIALTFDGAGGLRERFLYGPTVDQVIAQEGPGGLVRWALADQLGSVRDVVDGNGAVVNHLVYDSFGNIESESNPAVDFRFSYTGREFDEESGQYYYRARYYDAGVGRFLSEDPISFQGGDANLYRYVGNNSLTVVDPSGLLGRVTHQERRLRLSNGSRYLDNGLFQFRSKSGEYTLPLLAIPHLIWGGGLDYRKAYGSRGTTPDLEGASISSDITNAHIEYIPGTAGQKAGPRPNTIEPWGGKYRGSPFPDANGHIIGHLLGGTSTKEFNFFSQNSSINSGIFRVFEGDINKHLDVLGRKFDADLDEFYKQYSSYNHCSCLERKPAPKIPYVDMTVELGFNSVTATIFNGDYPFKETDSHPFRPFYARVTAVFSDKKTMTKNFTNNPDIKSSSPNSSF